MRKCVCKWIGVHDIKRETKPTNEAESNVAMMSSTYLCVNGQYGVTRCTIALCVARLNAFIRSMASRVEAALITS
eukprot:51634-Eustigmatos_ZCMA.PRE.1